MTDERCAYPTRYARYGPCEFLIRPDWPPCGFARQYQPAHGEDGHIYQPPVLERCGHPESEHWLTEEGNWICGKFGISPSGCLPLYDDDAGDDEPALHTYMLGCLCPDCGGTGNIDRETRTELSSKTTYIHGGHGLCPTCKGTRVVPIERESRV